MANISDEAVNMVVSMLSTEFDSVAVMDENLRRRLVRRMLEEEDFVGDALGKYELDELLRGGDEFGETLIEEQPRAMTLEMFLTADEKMQLIRNNRDVRVLFEPGVVMPHAYYFAQRIIDTDRCLRGLSHYGGEIIDIGGNYAAHHRQCRVVHSCTLLNSAREAHRQIERQVRMRAENKCVDVLDYCTVGAQLCSRQATQSMSVHAITDIPWEDWPSIMDRHGLSFHVAVFHYDPVMLTVPHGKLEGGFMYYAVQGDKVNFHFESDSSLDYTHNWTNFKKYTAPWCQFSKTSEWAYLYDLKHVQGGVATAEIVRVPQGDLGIQVPKPAFAYVPMEEKVSVSTWMYDMESGLDVDDPAAYMPVDLMVERDMYQFLYMYGLSNDSATPNKPMSLDEFRAMGRTYNQTRRFGDACITGKRKVASLTAYDVYDAIYHVVCRERAMLASRAAALTTAMISQQRVVDLSMVRIAVMLPLNAVGAALVLPGKAFEYYLKRFGEMWRQYLAGELKAAVAGDVPSYIPLEAQGYADIDGYHHDNKFAFERPFDSSLGLLALGSLDESVQNALAELGTPEDEQESFLDESASTIDASDTLVPSDSKSAGDKPYHMRRSSEEKVMTTDEYTDILADTALSVLTEDIVNSDYRLDQRGIMAEYAKIANAGSSVKFGTRIEPDVDKLHADYKSAMVEFGIYSFDVGHGVVSTLRLQCKQAFPSLHPDKHRLENMNAGQDIGAKVFECVGGSLLGEAAQYSVGVDPFTMKMHIIRKRKDGSVGVDDLSVKYLFVTSSVRIFNNYAVAKGVLRSLRSTYVPKYTMALVNGVPGCGKTSEIVDRYTLDDVVICAVRHSKDDTLSRLLKVERFAEHSDELKLRVRTLDSVVMHGFRGTGHVQKVFVDEGLMAFPGQLYSALEKLRPEQVYVYGDQFQIKAIDRSPSLGELVYKGIPAWSKVEYRDISHSMPADVCVLLSKHVYQRKIYTTSPVTYSLELTTHKSVTDEVFTSAMLGWEYLSVLTADKSKLLSGLNFVDGKKLLQKAVDDGDGQVRVGKGTSRVFTVHEAQGQRLARTCVVRMNPNTSAVLNSVEHVVVAISRHYLKCQYHAVATDDLLSKMFRDVVTVEQMKAIMKQPSAASIERIDRLRKGALE